MDPCDPTHAADHATTLRRRVLLAGLAGGTLRLALGPGMFRPHPAVLAAPATPAALSPPLGATFVGRTSDPDTFVALVLLDDPAGEAVAYLCAGPDLSLWFTGQVQDGALSLAGPDPAATATPEPGLTLVEPAPTLTGQLGPDGISGEARLPNLTLTFDAVPATGLAGLYVAERDTAGVVRGAASTGATLAAHQGPATDAAADAPFQITGTVTLADGTDLDLAIPAHGEGALAMRWIVLADGAVRGAGRRRRRTSDDDGEDIIDKLSF